MGLFDRIRNVFAPDTGRGVNELARRLAMPVEELLRVVPAYHTFSVPKRSGGQRTITAPTGPFKAFQRTLLRRVLARLPVHPAAMAFEPGHSIVHHAILHALRPVVVRMDIRDFFGATTVQRVHDCFTRLGWSRAAASLLTRCTTHDGGLPQGAPTSPKLANAVNYRLDAQVCAIVAAIAKRTDTVIVYSRYADDLTFSFDRDDHDAISSTICLVKQAIESSHGYRLHTKKKLRIMRRHDRQQVTGLVVNAGVNLPRRTRRRLRAVEHCLATGRDATMTHAQLQGWRSLEAMIAVQRGA